MKGAHRPTASSNYRFAKIKWLGRSVRVFIRGSDSSRKGPYFGVVRGLSDNEVAMEDEGGTTFEATGLLVEIPELGRESTFGDWPCRFDDAEII